MLKNKLKKIFINTYHYGKGQTTSHYQITFTAGVHWGWTPPQFNNAVINPIIVGFCIPLFRPFQHMHFDS